MCIIINRPYGKTCFRSKLIMQFNPRARSHIARPFFGPFFEVRTYPPSMPVHLLRSTYVPASERASNLTGISIIGLSSNCPLIDPSLGKITVSISTAVGGLYDTKVKVPTQKYYKKILYSPVGPRMHVFDEIYNF